MDTQPVVYVVTAYRWGHRDQNSYVVGVFGDKDAALEAVRDEEVRRGGKYECEVLACKLDHTLDDEDFKIIKRIPSFLDRQSGRMLRDLRVGAGMTEAEMAELAGLSPAQWPDLERGRYDIFSERQLDRIIRLAQELFQVADDHLAVAGLKKHRDGQPVDIG